MAISVDDLNNEENFKLILSVSYNDLVTFILEKIKTRTYLTIIYWLLCLAFLLFAVTIRISIAGSYPIIRILFHSSLGLIVFPILIIPVHELLHVIPYYFTGARNIRVGMDLKQYLFFVSAHRYVATPFQFCIVAILPYLLISVTFTLIIFSLPGLWKWSLSLFLFVHATMCAGDIAILNFYVLNRDKKIFTWDDVDKKESYFYQKINN